MGATIRALLLGVRDGWEQPYELVTSANVEHLDDGEGMTQEWLDRGINLGQFARAGFRSEAWALGYWPFKWNNKGDN